MLESPCIANQYRHECHGLKFKPQIGGDVLFAKLEEMLVSLFASSGMTAKLEQIVDAALIKACQAVSDSAKAGTLPDSLKPFAPILEFLAEAAEQVLTPKAS